MKHITLQSVILTIGLLFTSSSLLAADLDHQDVNLNSDGKVTESEILAVVKTHFLKIGPSSKPFSRPVTNVWEEEEDLH